ncbi:MAG TPA: histidine kinase dimerization/phosphoacceptor domain -containing protein, partial [Chthonomonadales bacterium]|nr:histidine kinase dimerization/phosphoacceptor domain -containing protein [Chthonomonadales bacterium]
MLGYFAIRRRRDLPYSHIFWLFGLFIVACGTTHFMGYYTFYHPIYRLDGLIKLITAWASWGTVLALIPVTPRALAMRSPEQLERIVSERTAALETEVAARKQTEETLRESKADVEQLNTRLQRAMAETHHRVKNNLQVISGLVELQTSTHEQGEATEEFKRIG